MDAIKVLELMEEIKRMNIPDSEKEKLIKTIDRINDIESRV